MLKFESWKETQKIENGGNVWTIFAYSNIVDLHPTGFDASRVATSDIDMREALIKSVTPQGKAQVYPIYPKQSVSISLDNSSVLLEPGAMLLTRGNVTMTLENPASGGSSVGGFFKRAVTSVASGESMIKPKFTGTGDVLLEPTKNFLFLIAIQDATFICDQGLWKACDGNLEVDAHINTFSAAVASGEGTVMPRVKGTGNILLESPVPKEKIMEVQINNEELRVDGPFVMAFWGDISFTTEKVSKGLMSSAASGEGYVNVYKGTGTLWINMEEAVCI